MADNRPAVLFLMGPTASGKTGLAMQLADNHRLRLISVDSTQVYRGLDIGSAKPAEAELKQYPHRLIDICDPAEPYSVAQFIRDAEREISLAHEQGITPLLVGGSMLYFRALLDGLAEIPVPDPHVRAQIEHEAKDEGWPHMHAELARVDPELAGALHPNHSQRIQRGLEVFRQTGQTLTDWRKQQSNRGEFLDRYEVRQLSLMPEDRSQLHQVIAQRFQQMVEQGLLDEVRGLVARGDLHEDLPAIRSVGYRQAWHYLHGKLAEDEWIEKAIAATRQLAKRQITWLRGWEGAMSVDPQASSPSQLLKFAQTSLHLG